MKLLRIIALLLVMGSTGCGYHLVGHGSGQDAIPADIKTLSITGNAEPGLFASMRQQLQSDRYAIVSESQRSQQSQQAQKTEATDHATLIIKMGNMRFFPSAYDRNGIASQYSLIMTGTLQLDRGSETIWKSGPIQRQGDVFVTGSPTSIEAARIRLQKDLLKGWLNDAVGRIRSGF